MDQLNLLLKNTLNSRLLGEDYPDIYIDYLNIACLLADVRNGVHLDTIQNDELIYNLKKELKLLGYDFNTRYETTIWNKDKITREQVLYSWAFEGDIINMNNPEYWANTGILLGNHLGYPTFTTDPKKQGSWSLNLAMNCNGITSFPMSMMGGSYDKSKIDDLQSVELVKTFLYTLVGHELYNPNGDKVKLEWVEIDLN
jgi:hypothetical protein